MLHYRLLEILGAGGAVDAVFAKIGRYAPLIGNYREKKYFPDYLG